MIAMVYWKKAPYGVDEEQQIRGVIDVQQDQSMVLIKTAEAGFMIPLHAILMVTFVDEEE